MARTIKILIGASMAVGMSAIALPPAFAGSLKDATITGSDYYLYEAIDKNNDGFLDTTQRNDNANLATILQGNCTVAKKACSPAGSPGGNVELFAQSESNKYKSLNAFAAAPVVSLSGKIGGESITLSSLTATDWFGTKLDIAYGASNLANTWFNTFITKAGYGFAVGSDSAKIMYNAFLGMGGFQASSDPNISYVNQDDITGDISIGLAGHYNLTAYYANSPYGSSVAFLPKGFQASEVVKYSYNGKTDYLYSFEAANSGLKEKIDGSSHSGNYLVSIKGVPPQKPIPEPSALLGIIAVGGLFVTRSKMQKQA